MQIGLVVGERGGGQPPCSLSGTSRPGWWSPTAHLFPHDRWLWRFLWDDATWSLLPQTACLGSVVLWAALGNFSNFSAPYQLRREEVGWGAQAWDSRGGAGAISAPDSASESPLEEVDPTVV